ncbi:RlpA-like double-psi beta-barrel-protein domain-containing protein-containing protein [Thamnocephalis sphaerospora]|uniref:RlpA-like double-psi beta-barrel-protein domain-containing protein-containing protein n=1 Tax=Thamnocephalis sphaerospora TaxID=78915 RepID=A0A4P9XV73_9FUNG|nr:RlpA-like double-psi beta-barrel-protein domain-containing protein-containing protein [Thamnocephalis sphaerospora]|eukprot:RKP10146.1 RlpA-like double-psi beta-barrel-protein domain-containing protein-containing protein [Thamnocephalis sphaerospora]
MRTFVSLVTLATAAAILSLQGADAATKSLMRRGQGTYYYMNGIPTACGEMHTDDELYAAVAYEWFTASNPNQDPICKKCALVRGPKGRVKVVVNDKCPTCTRDSIDLTPAAFDRIANRGDGRIQISWTFTAC